MAIVAPVLGFTPKSHTHSLTHSKLLLLLLPAKCQTPFEQGQQKWDFGHLSECMGKGSAADVRQPETVLPTKNLTLTLIPASPRPIFRPFCSDAIGVLWRYQTEREVDANGMFNMDETGPQRKKMPEHAYIMREEKSALGSKHSRAVSPSCWGLTWQETASSSLSWCTMRKTLVHSGMVQQPACPLVLQFHWLDDRIYFSGVQQAYLGAWVEGDYTLGLPFRILMILDNAPAHPHVL